MHPDRLIAALLAIAFPIFTTWLLLKASKERESNPSSEVKVMRFSKSWRAWCYVCVILFVLGFSSDLYLGKVKPDDQLFFWLSFFSFATLFGVGTWFLLAYRVEYDKEGLSVHWPTGRSYQIAWSNVATTEFKKGTGIVISVHSGKRQVIPSLLPGIDEFLKEAHTRTSKAA